MPKKKSFFERLTGTINTEDEALFDELESQPRSPAQSNYPQEEEREEDFFEEGEPAQLTVDMYQTPDEIVIKTMTAGVPPEEIDVSITREMVTITGRRQNVEEVIRDDYFHQELFWGSFSRTVLLPEEVDVDAADASEKHGMLTIRLPKIDKKRKTKLKIKSQ